MKYSFAMPNKSAAKREGLATPHRLLQISYTGAVRTLRNMEYEAISPQGHRIVMSILA